jgi:hypothetical protein
MPNPGARRTSAAAANPEISRITTPRQKIQAGERLGSFFNGKSCVKKTVLNGSERGRNGLYMTTELFI